MFEMPTGKGFCGNSVRKLGPKANAPNYSP